MKVGVTGANGFVGAHVLRLLGEKAHETRALVRRVDADTERQSETREIGDLGDAPEHAKLVDALRGVDVIVHLAAHVHVMSGPSNDDRFFAVNVEGSRALFRAALEAGVKRVIYVSSVKAVGEKSTDNPLTTEMAPAPEDAYGKSKLAAEEALRSLVDKTNIDLVILRPTFVYGWPASGNFATVIKAVQKGWPLPIAGIKNRRDMIYVGNLADAIVSACESSGLSATPYFVCDGHPVSTPALFKAVAKAFSVPSRLYYLPPQLLVIAATLIGKSIIIERLNGNFEVDAAPFRRDAGWQAPYNMDQGMAEIAQAAKSAQKHGA